MVYTSRGSCSGGVCSRRKPSCSTSSSASDETNPYLSDDDDYCCDEDCAGCDLSGCCGVGYKSKKMAKRRSRRGCGVQKRRKSRRGRSKSQSSYTAFIKKYFRDNHRSGAKATTTMRKAAAAWKRRRC